MTLALLWLISLFIGCSAQAAETYYVRTSGSDSLDGLTPETAFLTIQKGVNMCDGAGHIVYVGPGTYYEEVEIGHGAGEEARDGTAAQPNRIIGNPAGDITGDDPGQIIVDGENSRNYGIRLNKRDYWSLEHLTVHGQNAYAIYSDKSDGLRIANCTISPPTNYDKYAVYTYRGDDLTIVDNVIARTLDSGSGIYVVNCSGDVRVERNRFSLTGSGYLSMGYKTGTGQRGGYTYGILVYGYHKGSSNITVANNIGSDCYLGIYVYAYGKNCPARVECNSLSGCTYDLYTHTNKGTSVVADNIVTDSYYGMYSYNYRGTCTISGMLTNEITNRALYSYTRGGGSTSTEGIIEDEDPLWSDPAAGDFAIASTSPAVDAGLGQASAAADIRGVIRPFDGDGDETATGDFGAYEYNPEYDEEANPVIVRWREKQSY